MEIVKKKYSGVSYVMFETGHEMFKAADAEPGSRMPPICRPSNGIRDDQLEQTQKSPKSSLILVENSRIT